MKSMIDSIKISRFSDYIRPARDVIDYWKWRARGKKPPSPQLMKHRVIREYGKRYKIRCFIETGTYLGDTVNSVKNNFDYLYSIELSDELFTRAKKRFEKEQRIVIFHGDSADVLADLLPSISQPCVFWLDSHYSAGVTARGLLQTPIFLELMQITQNPVNVHVLLIDDARCFIGKNDYPLIEEVENILLKRYENYLFEVKDDIIRASPIRN
jgi:hypothetical protein